LKFVPGDDLGSSRSQNKANMAFSLSIWSGHLPNLAIFVALHASLQELPVGMLLVRKNGGQKTSKRKRLTAAFAIQPS